MQNFKFDFFKLWIVIFLIIFLYLFRQFSENGRYTMNVAGGLIDTRTGAVYVLNEETGKAEIIIPAISE